MSVYVCVRVRACVHACLVVNMCVCMHVCIVLISVLLYALHVCAREMCVCLQVYVEGQNGT